MKPFHLLIDGRLVQTSATIDVINPATEKTVASCPRAGLRELEAAVAAAKAAFPSWAALGIDQRRVRLMAIAESLMPRCGELASLLTAEQGKPLAEAMAEMGGVVGMIQCLGSLDLPAKVLKEDQNGKTVEHRTPLGVIAAITPWNVPMVLLIVKVVPALLAGNTVVAKPASSTPLTTLRFAEICNEHLPPGVFNVITDDNDLGGALSSHPDVAKIAFTGSTATGKKVVQAAASSLKRLTLELGGNDAAIVLDDADPKLVAPKLLAGAMGNAGQICLAIKRVYVADSIYDAICDELARLANAVVVGDGSHPDTQMGPLQNKAQYEKVKKYIEDARSDGKIIAGGEVSSAPGYFIRPTIVRDIDDHAPLVQEEQFGPVLPVLRYSTLEDAIARANDTPYGLGGSVWSGSPERGLDVAMKINSGVVWVNTHMAVDPFVPMGGAKQSGMGLELGHEGLHEFTQRHIVVVANGI